MKTGMRMGTMPVTGMMMKTGMRMGTMPVTGMMMRTLTPMAARANVMTLVIIKRMTRTVRRMNPSPAP